LAELDLQFPSICSQIESPFPAVSINYSLDLPNQVFFHHGSGLHLAHLELLNEQKPDEMLHKLICTTPLAEKSTIVAPLIGLAIVQSKLVGSCAVALSFDGLLKVVDLSMHKEADNTVVEEPHAQLVTLPPPPQYCFPEAQPQMSQKEADLFLASASEKLAPTLSYLEGLIPKIQQQRNVLVSNLGSQEMRIKQLQVHLQESEEKCKKLETLRAQVRRKQAEQRAKLAKLLSRALTPPFPDATSRGYMDELNKLAEKLDSLQLDAQQALAQRSQWGSVQCTAPLAPGEIATITQTLKEPQASIRVALETVQELYKNVHRSIPTQGE